MDGTEGNQWFQIRRDHRTGKRVEIPIDTNNKKTSQVKTYAQAVKDGHQHAMEKFNHQSHQRNTVSSSIYSVMVHNLPTEANSREIWMFFNSKRLIRDIKLPRKRDVNNFRYGFLMVLNYESVCTLVEEFNGKVFKDHKLLVKISKNSEQQYKFLKSKATRRNHKQDYQDNIKLKTNNREPILVPQPTFRIVNGTADMCLLEDLKTSLIGETKEPCWADVLQENLIAQGISSIKVTGISHFTFLLKCLDEDFLEWEINNTLKDMFLVIRKAIHTDLVVPRTTWIHCDGLHVFAWNDDTIKNIIGDWGYVITTGKKLIENNTFLNPNICVQTHQVKYLDETLKVIVNGVGHWIRLKETKCYFSNEDCFMHDPILNHNLSDAININQSDSPISGSRNLNEMRASPSIRLGELLKKDRLVKTGTWIN